jgi:4-hydroxy-tetrahydrodipicolinate reductase
MSEQESVLRLPEPGRRYRVVQWATGRIGAASLRELILSPQFDLVGVYVHSEAKAGRDAGELCGLPETGVLATRDIEAIIALKPDCVVANQEGANVDDVCRFLGAGINIATSRVDFLDPERMQPEAMQRTQAACHQGGASIHATGASPGFSSEALPLLAASMSRRMECMTIDEYADIPASCPDFQVIDGMGFGRPQGDGFDPDLLAHIAHGFEQSVSVVARGLGIAIDDFQVSGETAGARQRFLLPGGTPIEQGTVAAQRITVAGMAGGRAVIRYRINWYCTTELDQAWDLRRSGWRLLIEGETPIDITISFPVADDQVAPAMAGITAYRVVNAIPYVCAAEPGIRTSLQLPPIVPMLG